MGLKQRFCVHACEYFSLFESLLLVFSTRYACVQTWLFVVLSIFNRHALAQARSRLAPKTPHARTHACLRACTQMYEFEITVVVVEPYFSETCVRSPLCARMRTCVRVCFRMHVVLLSNDDVDIDDHCDDDDVVDGEQLKPSSTVALRPLLGFEPPLPCVHACYKVCVYMLRRRVKRDARAYDIILHICIYATTTTTHAHYITFNSAAVPYVCTCAHMSVRACVSSSPRRIYTRAHRTAHYYTAHYAQTPVATPRQQRPADGKGCAQCERQKLKHTTHG